MRKHPPGGTGRMRPQPAHIEGVPQVAHQNKRGFTERAKALFREADALGLRVTKIRRHYLLYTPDEAVTGIMCDNLDELDEEIDNWRV